MLTLRKKLLLTFRLFKEIIKKVTKELKSNMNTNIRPI
jgi:hypothetical protein